MTYTEKGEYMIKFLGFENQTVIAYWTALEKKQFAVCDTIFDNFMLTLAR